LWAFNTEIVADTVFNLSTPSVSAVGHEIDVLISDFIADLRSPTPSASIEMIFPDSFEILYTLNELENRFNETIKQKLSNFQLNIKHNLDRLKDLSTHRKLEEKKNNSIRLKEEFKRVISYKVEQKLNDIAYIKNQLSMLNPKNNTKDGWAKVSINNKVVNLKDIDINQKFILEDRDTKLEVICIDKKPIFLFN
jgi:exodeoxyribonuclease VII large subunit